MPGKLRFFILCMSIALFMVVVLPLLGAVFTTPDIPEAAARGYAVWQGFDCAGCHTINGLGGTYAPDLTHIYSERGETYLRDFLVNPGAFHPNALRIMPRLGLTVAEISDVLAFLQWIDQASDAFPPRPTGMGAGAL